MTKIRVDIGPYTKTVPRPVIYDDVSGKYGPSVEPKRRVNSCSASATPVVGAPWRSPAATVATPAGATQPHRS
jgi:hypothetical protein